MKRTTADPALSVSGLTFVYPPASKSGRPRTALSNVSFEIGEGDFFCILGPNGSGKSTLFKVLSTATLPPSGHVMFFGHQVGEQLRLIRSQLGVVFQNPALDRKLTVKENLNCHGRLYRMPETAIRTRSAELLELLGVSDRSSEPVETLSGGLARRVELAKALLHSPRLLLLDEPTTGLDPTARAGFLGLLRRFQAGAGTTIVYTTHILEEAEDCDALLILDEGSVVASGTPGALRSEIGKELIIMKSRDPVRLLESVRKKYDLPVYRVDDAVRVECDNASAMIGELLGTYEGTVDIVTFSRPSVGDVYIKKTGHQFRSKNDTAS
ncbi:MAG TPA: ABC transporter ATP-binding protein [Bacteroidota bacterium]|nr:ABC transporter ATP-binding protein [Bacteroidota bacterium]